MVNRDADFQNVIKWNNQWASIGIIGLSAKSIPKLKKFRDHLNAFEFQGRTFTYVVKETVSALGLPGQNYLPRQPPSPRHHPSRAVPLLQRS